MAGQMCVTVGEHQVHLDTIASAVTTADGQSLNRQQWLAFAQRVVQLLLSLFAGGIQPPPADISAEPQAATPEQAGPPHPNRPRPH